MKIHARPLLLFCAGIVLLGCSDSPRNQERVRDNTARATAAIASSAKSAVLGIRDGLARKPVETGVNINTADRSELEDLPGVTSAMADQIIRNRPYKDPVELRRKHILPNDVYKAISGRLIVHH